MLELGRLLPSKCILPESRVLILDNWPESRLGREHSEAALPPVLARRSAGPFVLVAPFVFEVEGELPAVLTGFELVSRARLPTLPWSEAQTRQDRIEQPVLGEPQTPKVDDE